MSSSRRTFIGRSLAALGAGLFSRGVPAPLRDLNWLPEEGAHVDERFWRRVRREFDMPRDEAFFNTGSLGAQPQVVVDAVVDDLERISRNLAQWNYDGRGPRYQTGYDPELELRTRLGALVGAGPDEVGLTVNATMGMNFLAQGLELASGDEVVLMAGAHPGGRCGWELRARRDGIRLNWVEPPRTVSHPSELLRAYEKATNPRTRVWAIPHLTSGFGGILFPVDEMCVRARSLGILSVVDGAQSLGQRRIDMRAMGCDAFFASAHKWLLAPTGCGLLFIRQDQQPRWWTTLAGRQWDNHDDGMFRFMQYGAANASLLAGYEAALDFHLALGPERIHERIIKLTRHLREGLKEIDGVTILSPHHPTMLTGITAWSVGDLPGFELQEALWNDARVRVRAAGDSATAVRQCCHIYTTVADVKRSLAATGAIARRLGGHG